MTGVLLAASTLNAMHLFTQSKTYRLHRRTKADPVSSPRTTFVTSPARARALSSDEPSKMASFKTRILRVIKVIIIFLWTCFISFWKFLLGISTPTPSSSSPARGAPADQIQQLEVWTPGELERVLLSIYSPVHALIWMSTGPTNWILMTAVMCAVGVQTSLLVQAYEGLVKDRAILAAEVMHEYNEGVSCHLAFQGRTFFADMIFIYISVRVSANECREERCRCHDASIGDGEYLGRLVIQNHRLRDSCKSSKRKYTCM